MFNLWIRVKGLGLLGPGVSPFSFCLGLGFPDNPLRTKKGTLLVPRLLPGLEARAKKTDVDSWLSWDFTSFMKSRMGSDTPKP